MNTKHRRVSALLPILALALSAPVAVRATESTADAEASLAAAKGDAAQTALKQLDVEIDRVDAMIDNAPTKEDKEAAKARMDVLKERRSELRKTYVKAKYDELSADVRAEAAKVSAWTKRTFTRDPAKKAADEMEDAAESAKKAAVKADSHAYAYAHSTGATVDIEAYKLRPTDTNKEEAKAALKALSLKIDELEDRADRMPKGPDRDAAQRRVKALEDRKDELQHQFNKARFDALIDDVKAAWN